MIKTTLPAKRAISEIVRAYRQLQSQGERLISLRAFAAALSEILKPHGGSISHQSVKNWEDRTHLPHTFYMKQITMQAPNDWRRDFAQDILGVLHPDLYQTATAIGARAVENAKHDTSFYDNLGGHVQV